MVRVVVAVDPGVGIEPQELAEAWAADAEAASLGAASLEPTQGGVFLPGVVELVVVPLAVNLASSVLYDVAKRLVASRRPAAAAEVEVVVHERADGDRVVVVRVDAGGP